MNQINPVESRLYQAVLFDLDGVLTATAKVHAVAWKKMFDKFLEGRARASGQTFVPFDIELDYKRYVDGKLRYEGVRCFLQARGLRLQEGDPEDPPGADTICGLGNRKDQLVNAVLESEGVETYPDSVSWIQHLRQSDIKVGVVSSSRNCQTVLEVAGIERLFDVRVDGKVADELGLPGKPAPDTFLRAAQILGIAPSKTVVVEDAIAGVQAGKAGGFGLVIGVSRGVEADALRQAGADVVVSSLDELR